MVERSWLQVWADGRQVFAEMVAPGTTRVFTANDTLQMRVSNAGGVQVTVNGEPQGRLGASGQAVDVVRAGASAVTCLEQVCYNVGRGPRCRRGGRQAGVGSDGDGEGPGEGIGTRARPDRA